MKLGFIGIGTMGKPMVSNLLHKTGEQIAIYNTSQKVLESLTPLGAIACSSIAEVASYANLIFIMVPNNDHVKAVVDQIAPFIQKNTIICNCSSISPSVERECVQKIEANGGFSIEAPVVKSQGAAIAGTLGILTAGPEDIVRKVTPFLLMMGESVIYYGDHGNGMTMKILHNMLVGNIQNGVNEMFVMAEAAGLDFDLVMDGIKAGGGQNFYLDGKGPSIKASEYSPKFSVRNMAKDTKLHGLLKDELQLELPGSDRVREIYEKAMQEIPDEDFSATYKIVRKCSRSG